MAEAQSISVKVESNVLTDEQMTRIAALQAARDVLVAKGFTSSEKAEADELHRLAEYIVSGGYPLEAVIEAPRRWLRRRPRMEALDTP